MFNCLSSGRLFNIFKHSNIKTSNYQLVTTIGPFFWALQKSAGVLNLQQQLEIGVGGVENRPDCVRRRAGAKIRATKKDNSRWGGFSGFARELSRLWLGYVVVVVCWRWCVSRQTQFVRSVCFFADRVKSRDGTHASALLRPVEPPTSARNQNRSIT